MRQRRLRPIPEGFWLSAGAPAIPGSRNRSSTTVRTPSDSPSNPVPSFASSYSAPTPCVKRISYIVSLSCLNLRITYPSSDPDCCFSSANTAQKSSAYHWRLCEFYISSFLCVHGVRESFDTPVLISLPYYTDFALSYDNGSIFHRD